MRKPRIKARSPLGSVNVSNFSVQNKGYSIELMREKETAEHKVKEMNNTDKNRDKYTFPRLLCLLAVNCCSNAQGRHLQASQEMLVPRDGTQERYDTVHSHVPLRARSDTATERTAAVRANVIIFWGTAESAACCRIQLHSIQAFKIFWVFATVLLTELVTNIGNDN